jgi:hypothetical protein
MFNTRSKQIIADSFKSLTLVPQLQALLQSTRKATSGEKELGFLFLFLFLLVNGKSISFFFPLSSWNHLK